MLWFAALALPGTIMGAWLGARLYHALTDRSCREFVQSLLIHSGAMLLWYSIGA